MKIKDCMFPLRSVLLNKIVTIFIALILLVLPLCLTAQKKNYRVVDTTTIKRMENNKKKFDIEYFDKNKNIWTWDYHNLEFVKEDGTKIEQVKSIDNYFYEEDKDTTLGYKERENKIMRPLGIYDGSYYSEYETPPLPKFYKIFRKFYLNGNLKEEGILLPGDLHVGIWREYDEQGNLTKETNWDETYGKFDYNKAILFLAKHGHINIKTGKGRDEFTIGVSREKHCWDVNVWPRKSNNYKGFEYLLDLDTGKVKKKGKIFPSEG